MWLLGFRVSGLGYFATELTKKSNSGVVACLNTRFLRARPFITLPGTQINHKRAGRSKSDVRGSLSLLTPSGSTSHVEFNEEG